MDIPRFKKFAKMYLALQKMKAKEKQIQEFLDKEQTVLIDQLVDDGITKFSLAGGVTLFVKTMIWAKYEDRQAAIKAIKDSDISDLLEESFHAGRLASYLRELDREDKDLPESFKGIISPNPTQSLIAKKI